MKKKLNTWLARLQATLCTHLRNSLAPYKQSIAATRAEAMAEPAAAAAATVTADAIEDLAC